MRRLLLALLLIAASARAAEVPLLMRGNVLRVAVTGDTGDGTGEIAPLIAKVHAAEPLDAIILTGDNFYPCGVDSWSDPRWSIVRPLAAIGIPIFPVLGNHDYCGRLPFAQIGAPLWTFPAKEYAVRSRVADFVMIDTTPLAEHAARDAELAIPALLAGATAPWRIVVGRVARLLPPRRTEADAAAPSGPAPRARRPLRLRPRPPHGADGREAAAPHQRRRFATDPRARAAAALAVSADGAARARLRGAGDRRANAVDPFLRQRCAGRWSAVRVHAVRAGC
jgi:hypothetical protein